MKGKQKRYLRSLAVNEPPIFQIGKGGVSDGMVDRLSEALEARELIKIRVLNNSGESAGELAPAVAAATQSRLIQVIGHNIVLYRRSRKNPRIELP